MAYAIMRINKCKMGTVGRLEKHHEREKEKYKSNPDIDLSQSHNNFHLKTPTGSYRSMILQRIEEVGSKGQCCDAGQYLYCFPRVLRG